MDPTSAAVNQEAPAEFKAEFTTTKGTFVLQMHREWAPIGADRFYSLVKNGFFDGQLFFRVVPNFVVQFGIPGEPTIAKVWATHPKLNPKYHKDISLKDDPVKQKNKRGTITYAQGKAPNSRSTQVFINLQDNPSLDSAFAPFGEVVEGFENVLSLFGEHGDRPLYQSGELTQLGNAYLLEKFPGLDSIEKARIVD